MNELKSGYLTLIEAAQRTGKYTGSIYDRYFEEEYYLTTHPFGGSQSTRFVGSMGSSASVGAFLHFVAGRLHAQSLAEPATDFTLHFLPEPDGVGNLIVAEAYNQHESIMVGGMTDYSGEGGAAFKMVRNALSFLALLNGKIVKQKHHSGSANLMFRNFIEAELAPYYELAE